MSNTPCRSRIGRGRKDALLRQALDHLYRPSPSNEHYWYNGDLVIWDNLACKHARGDQDGQRRAHFAACRCASQKPFRALPEISLSDPDMCSWVNCQDPVANRYLLERVLDDGPKRRSRRRLKEVFSARECWSPQCDRTIRLLAAIEQMDRHRRCSAGATGGRRTTAAARGLHGFSVSASV